jgi:hypothetical protein
LFDREEIKPQVTSETIPPPNSSTSLQNMIQPQVSLRAGRVQSDPAISAGGVLPLIIQQEVPV